jgi:hypothetical protein
MALRLRNFVIYNSKERETLYTVVQIFPVRALDSPDFKNCYADFLSAGAFFLLP